MLDRSKISSLAQSQDGPVTIGGWVETLPVIEDHHDYHDHRPAAQPAE